MNAYQVNVHETMHTVFADNETDALNQVYNNCFAEEFAFDIFKEMITIERIEMFSKYIWKKIHINSKINNERRMKELMDGWAAFESEIQEAQELLDSMDGIQSKQKAVERVHDAIEILIIGLCRYKGKLNIQEHQNAKDI